MVYTNRSAKSLSEFLSHVGKINFDFYDFPQILIIINCFLGYSTTSFKSIGNLASNGKMILTGKSENSFK
jgi:hypothetical protein